MSNNQNRRVRLKGSIEVALPIEGAFALFTPSGESTWAHGWHPRFPSSTADETEPGTVFETSHGGRESIWIVVGGESGRSIEYATATPGQRCGLVAVACQASGEATRATVSYDLTALNPEADAELDAFAADYPSFLAHWERSFAEVVRR